MAPPPFLGIPIHNGNNYTWMGVGNGGVSSPGLFLEAEWWLAAGIEALIAFLIGVVLLACIRHSGLWLAGVAGCAIFYSIASSFFARRI